MCLFWVLSSILMNKYCQKEGGRGRGGGTDLESDKVVDHKRGGSIV